MDCIIGTKGRKKNEGGLPPRRARSGQRGKRSREYDRFTKSDRQIASTTKPRLRQCVTARQRPHFPLHQSQQHGRCRRKGSSEYEKSRLFITNRRRNYQSFLLMTLGMSVYYGMLWVLFLAVRRSSHLKFDVARRSAVTSLADNKRSLSVKVLVFEEILNELC